MSMMLFNPTNEDFENLMFEGKSMALKSGEKMKVSDPCGHHLLNKFTARGLSVLEFSEDPKYLEKVKADAIRRNLEFKKNMVTRHNYMNVTRKQKGLSYLEPTEYIKKAAKELNIKLDEPYAQQDEQKDQIMLLKQENQDLRRTIEETNNMIRQLMAERLRPHGTIEPTNQPDARAGGQPRK